MKLALWDIFNCLLLTLPGVFSKSLHDDSHYSIKIPGIETTTERQMGEDLMFGCPEVIKCNHSALYREFDGKCNNLINPSWGSSGIAFRRFLPAQYNYDLSLCGSKKRLPTPRKIVAALNKLSVRNTSTVTVMNMQWGQFISHDITLTPSVHSLKCCVNCSSKPIESEDCMPINVKDDSFYKKFNIECLENRRSAPAGSLCRNKREQVNANTAYIDGSVVYGLTKEAADELRTMSNGQMKVRDGEENLNGGSCPAAAVCPFKFLPTVLINRSERIIAGDPRASQQPSLISLHTLFIRVHNDIAKRLASKHKKYNDEKLYQETRQIVVALIQHITYNEYLPSILPSWALFKYCLKSISPGLGYFTGYNYLLDASLRNAFSAAAYRFGHSLIPDQFDLPNGKNVELSKSFINHTFTFNFGTYPSDFLNGISSQRSPEIDQNLVSSVANKLFARGPDFDKGSDLYSTNILRGRDHGLPSYAQWRKFCDLPCVTSSEDLKSVMKDGVAEIFEKLYDSIEDIDLYPALISEKHDSDGIVGPTLTCLLSEQFRNLKLGDRFYYENLLHPNRFTMAQLDSIRRTSLASLLCRYTNKEEIPKFVMKVLGKGNKMKKCQKVLEGTLLALLESHF